MNPENNKEIVTRNNSEAVWVVGVLCGIVLIILLVFSVRRGTELTSANEKIESLTQENKALTDENKELHQQIDELKEKYNKEQEKAAAAEEKAGAYDDMQNQIEQFSKSLQDLFSGPGTAKEG